MRPQGQERIQQSHEAAHALKQSSIIMSIFSKLFQTYIEGRYLIASSSSEGQGAGTRFSEKSHLIFFLCDAGPRVGHLISFVGPITAFKNV